MSGHIDELVRLVESVGGKVRLHGREVSARDLRTFAWALFVDRFTNAITAAAARRLCVAVEPQWSFYP
jgi:hypothetical protein